MFTYYQIVPLWAKLVLAEVSPIYDSIVAFRRTTISVASGETATKTVNHGIVGLIVAINWTSDMRRPFIGYIGASVSHVGGYTLAELGLTMDIQSSAKSSTITVKTSASYNSTIVLYYQTIE